MSVYVVILNWNGWQDTIECLESLFKSTGADFKVIVCDNASADGSLTHITQWAQSALGEKQFINITRKQVEANHTLFGTNKLVLIDNADNLGFAGGNNVGVKLALQQDDCDYVWLLNNDTTVEPDALANTVTRMQKDESIGVCGSTLIYFYQRHLVQAMGGASYSKWSGRAKHLGALLSTKNIPKNPSDVEKKLSYIIGAAMLIKRQFIETVGVMQDDYFLYFEEIDWATRASTAFKLGYAPSSVVYHKEGASIGTAPSGGSALSVYYLFKNRIKFTWRHYPFCMVTVLFFCILEIVKMLLKGQLIQAKAAVKGLLFITLKKPNGLKK